MSNAESTKMTLSIQEVSKLTGLSVPYLYALSSKGGLPVTKVGSRCLIFRDDLEAWLRSKSRKVL